MPARGDRRNRNDSEPGEQDIERIGERIAVFGPQPSGMLTDLGKGQRGERLSDKDVILPVDPDDRIETGNRFTQGSQGNQRNDNPRSQLRGGMIGLDIDNISPIVRQPEQVKASHGNQNFLYFASGTPFCST